MALIELKRDPTRRDYQVFGGLLVVATALAAYFAFRSRSPLGFAGVATACGVLVLAAYTANLPLRRAIYRLGMKITSPIGLALSYLWLAVIFYLVVTPIGLLRRTFGKDPLAREIDREATNYWVELDSRSDPSEYLRPY